MCGDQRHPEAIKHDMKLDIAVVPAWIYDTSKVVDSLSHVEVQASCRYTPWELIR